MRKRSQFIKEPDVADLNTLPILVKFPARQLVVNKLVALREFIAGSHAELARMLGVERSTVVRWVYQQEFPGVSQCAKIDLMCVQYFTERQLGQVRDAKTHRGWINQRLAYEKRMGLPRRSSKNHKHRTDIPARENDNRLHPVCAAVERAIRIGMEDKIPNDIRVLYNEVMGNTE